MELITAVDVKYNCQSVTHHAGKLYVKRTGGVDVVEDGKSTELISEEVVNCIRVHNQQLYLLKSQGTDDTR